MTNRPKMLSPQEKKSLTDEIEMLAQRPASKETTKRIGEIVGILQVEKEAIRTILRRLEENDPVEGDQEERLARLKGIISKIEWGRELLALAEKTGCGILMKTDLPCARAGSFSPLSNEIDLRAQLTDADIVLILVHELRHMWQKHHVPDEASCSMPEAIIQSRILEGDAHAFVEAFIEELLKADPDMLSFLLTAELQHVFERAVPLGQSMTMQDMFWHYQYSDESEVWGYDKDRIGIWEDREDLIRQIDVQLKILEQAKKEFDEKYAASNDDAGKAEMQDRMHDTFNLAAEKGGQMRALRAELMDGVGRPLPEALNQLLVRGLSLDCPKYIDFKDVAELSAAITAHIPADTLKKAHELQCRIIQLRDADSGIPQDSRNEAKPKVPSSNGKMQP